MPHRPYLQKIYRQFDLQYLTEHRLNVTVGKHYSLPNGRNIYTLAYIVLTFYIVILYDCYHMQSTILITY